MNPILPLDTCIPDGEPRVFGERVYLYGSKDQLGEMDYCSHAYYVYSAPVNDLANWTNHGLVFASKGPGDQVPWSDARLYAPDVIEKDGTYYLYFCLADGTEGVATSPWPTGPFCHAVQIFYPEGIKQGGPLTHIDPAVFVDDDGSAYYYWGQFHAQCAKLKDNMFELEPSSYQSSMISEESHYFHEGSSMRKVGDTYYFIYCGISTGRANTLNYATGHHPLGPFDYRGEIINNVEADPESWNIHGSIVEIAGQWYVFYHRSSNNSRFSRRACIEPITIDESGTIHRAEMTTGGAQGLLDPYKIMPAARACYLKGGNYISTARDGVYPLINNGDRCYAGFKYFNFGPAKKPEKVTFEARLYIESAGKVELILDDPQGEPLAVMDLKGYPKETWSDLTLMVERPIGNHAIYLKFTSNEEAASICRLSWFRFVDR